MICLSHSCLRDQAARRVLTAVGTQDDPPVQRDLRPVDGSRRLLDILRVHHAPVLVLAEGRSAAYVHSLAELQMCVDSLPMRENTTVVPCYHTPSTH